MHTRIIPTSGEALPVIGLGTWRTFDVGVAARARSVLIEVLSRLAAAGGRLIDSSPMYGSAEAVVGDLKKNVPGCFLATKVWTRGREAGLVQMRRSLDLLGVRRIDLLQVHNLVDWRTQLQTLREWKASGRVRYIGVTHYQVEAFPQLASILQKESIDFVQLPFSIGVPEAAERLLPLAADRQVAVIVNRPFEAGRLLRGLDRRTLPDWAAEFDCQSWAEIFLRWILAYPEVTCVIPATSQPMHMSQNLRAGLGRTLSSAERDELRRRALVALKS